MSEERDYEGEARTSGWVPQESWKGPADRWVDAKTFVERGEQFFPFVQAKLKKSLEKIDVLEGTVNELREGNKQFREFSEKALERERKEKERVLEELEAKKAQAISDGDGPKAVQIERQIKQVEKEPVRSAQTEPPEVTAWKSANAWYGSDMELSAIADGLSDVVARENPSLRGKAFLDKLTERVQSVVPHKFQNARREESVTTDHQRKTPSQKVKTYDSLPEEAKTHCERFLKTIPGFTREAFLSQYEWSES
jgi:hypothetical protein